MPGDSDPGSDHASESAASAADSDYGVDSTSTSRTTGEPDSGDPTSGLPTDSADDGETSEPWVPPFECDIGGDPDGPDSCGEGLKCQYYSPFDPVGVCRPIGADDVGLGEPCEWDLTVADTRVRVG